MRKTEFLLKAAAISIIAASVPAMAQGVPATGTADGQAAPADQSEATGEIVVTAQRKSENLQDVPMAITALPEATLKELNLTTIKDVQMVTPGLVLNTGYSYAQTFIRGIGASTPNTGLEGAVSYYIDGSYLERNFGTVTDFFDMSSVQVLKGAQGTLYGRNATGGTVLLQTADPTPDASLRLSGEYGRFNRVVGEAVANVPLSDSVAFRLALRESHQDGYITNLFDGEKLGNRKSYTARGKLRWESGPDFNAILTLEYSKKVEGSPVQQLRASGVNCLTCTLFGVQPVAGFYQTNQDTFVPLNTRSYVGNLRLHYDLGSVALESTTGYRDEQSRVITEQDMSALPLFNFAAKLGGKTFTQDLQLSSDWAGAFNVLVGADYLHDKGFYDATLSGGFFIDPFMQTGAFPNTHNDIDSTSVSGFAELYVTPVQDLKVTLGGRYTHEKRTLVTTRNKATFTGVGAPAGGSGALGLVINQEASANSFTPRVVIAYDMDTVNIYASWNRGFKAGGFASPIFALGNIVSPEKIDYFDGGIKFVSPDRKVHINGAVFYYDYRDIQVPFIDITAGGQTVANAGAAEGYGFELDASFAPSKWINIFGNIAYLHARYTSYPAASVNIPTPAGLAGGIENLKGFPLERAPDWTASLGANLSTPIGGDWKGSLNGVVHYTDDYYFYAGGGGPLRQAIQPAHTLANLTGSVGPVDDSFSIGFYIDNLTNKKYFDNRSTQAPFGFYDSVAMPRTYGVRVSANF